MHWYRCSDQRRDGNLPIESASRGRVCALLRHRVHAVRAPTALFRRNAVRVRGYHMHARRLRCQPAVYCLSAAARPTRRRTHAGCRLRNVCTQRRPKAWRIVRDVMQNGVHFHRPPAQLCDWRCWCQRRLRAARLHRHPGACQWRTGRLQPRWIAGAQLSMHACLRSRLHCNGRPTLVLGWRFAFNALVYAGRMYWCGGI